MNKIVLVVSAAIITLGFFSESLAVPSGSCGNTCSWTIEGGVLKITGTGAMTDYTKNNSAPWTSYNSSIKSVDIGNGITDIGAYSFYNMSNVTNLNIPNSVISIKNDAFSGMSGVTSLTIPNSVTNIGGGAFKNMSKVPTLTIPDSVTSIGNWVFEGMTSLSGQLVLPDSITEFGASILHNDRITSLILPDSAVLVAPSNYGDALRFMGSMSELVIPDTLDVSEWADFSFSRFSANIRCQGDVATCKDNLARFGTSITNKISAVNNKSQCTGKYTWDTTSSTCRRMTSDECNAVEKYYYDGSLCKSLPKDQEGCNTLNASNGLLSWNTTNKKCEKSKCPENCGTCSSSTVCTKCSDDYLLKDDGSCVTTDECNNGFHVSGTSCATNPEGCNKYSAGNCSECNDGYLSNSAGLCTKTEDCNGTNFVDSEAKACKPIPGCVDFSDGACSCEKGYYKKDGGCVSESVGCGAGSLGKEGECISSENGCGDSYKDMGGYCNRVRYTPAEAAAIANDDSTNVVTLTFKK